MAKDPAFLFYPNDYMGGTIGMTFEEKGAYMDLLILQFNNGPFTVHQAKKTLNGSFEHIWPEISPKFVHDGHRYFNMRLEEEKIKRSSFIEMQSGRGKKAADKRWNKDAQAMHKQCTSNNIIENENRDIDDLGKEGVGEKPFPDLPAKTLEAAEMNQWTFTKNRNTEFIKDQWLVFTAERMNDPPERLKHHHQNPAELFQYFLNWLRNKHPKNGNSKSTNDNPKPGTSEARISRARSWGSERTGAGVDG
jgi:uncharacterized protein YdaU (DUF1376 family)